MAKLCKKKCVIEEADKFCREHGELLKCRDGHEILASSGLCKEDSSPPIESVSSNNSNYNADIQTILRGLTSQLSEGMADSLVKALANNSSGNGKAPPEFVKDPKDLEQWKIDVNRWADFGGCPKVNQGSVVLMHIPKDHKFKRIMETELGNEVKNKEDSLQILIKFVEKIMAGSDPLEKFYTFVTFFNKRREQGQTILEYTAEWDTLWSQLSAKGVKIDDELLSWWYFSTLNLPVHDLRNIFTQISILKERSDSTKTMLEHAKDAARSHEAIDSLEKISSGSNTLAANSDENTLVSREGNGFNQYGIWRRCFNCRDTCKHDKKKPCKCPCAAHLSPECPLPKKENGKKKPWVSKRKAGDNTEEESKGSTGENDKKSKKTITDSVGYTKSFMSELGLTSDQCFYAGDETIGVTDNNRTRNPLDGAITSLNLSHDSNTTLAPPADDVMMEELDLLPAQCLYLQGVPKKTGISDFQKQQLQICMLSFENKVK